MFGLGINKVYKFARGLVADFRAKLLSTSIVRGIGELSPPSIGDSDGDRLVADHENIWRSCKAEEVRIAGARRVENLFTDSYGFGDVVTNGTASITDNSDGTANLTGLNTTDSDSTQITALTGISVTDRSFVGSIKIKAASASEVGKTAQVVVKRAFGGSIAQESFAVELGADFKRVSGSFTGLASNIAARIIIRAPSSGSNPIGPSDTVVISEPQMEESTGRSDTTTPSEYVSTGVGTGDELIDDPSFDVDFASSDWVDSSTGTGTAVISGGQLTTTRVDGSNLGSARQEFATEIGATYVFETEVASGTAWRVFIGTTAGASDVSNTTLTNKVVFTATSATTWVQLSNFTNGSSAVWDSFSVKRINPGWNVDGVKYYITENGNSVTNNVVTEGFGANLTTIKGLYMEGAHTELSGRSADLGNVGVNGTPVITQDAVGLSGATNEAFTLEDDDPTFAESAVVSDAITSGVDTYYSVTRIAYNSSPSVYPRLLLQFLGGTLTQQAIVFDPSDGSYVENNTDGEVVSVIRLGGFWHVVLSLADNSSGNTTVQGVMFPSWNTDGAAAVDLTAQGSTVFASCELYKDSPSFSPILTTGGTPKTVNADTEYTLDVANWPDGDVSASFELTPYFEELPSSQGIITPNSTTVFRGLYFSSSGAFTTAINDGPNSGTLNNSWNFVGDSVVAKMRAGNGTMNLVFDGSTRADITYDGSFNAAISIMLGKSLTRAMAIKELKIYSVDLGNDWLT